MAMARQAATTSRPVLKHTRGTWRIAVPNIYDLAPLLSRGNSFEDLLKKQVGEFEAITQIPACVEIRGEAFPFPFL